MAGRLSEVPIVCVFILLLLTFPKDGNNYLFFINKGFVGIVGYLSLFLLFFL